jgi:hypothetical protein
MVIRKAERDVAIPESTKAYRAAVVLEADRLETAIAACVDVEGLIAVVNSQNWPVQANPYPTDGEMYIWNEETTSWVLFVRNEHSDQPE